MYQPSQCIGWYLGFTYILVSAKTLSSCWQNAVVFLTHPDNLHKKAQRSQDSYLTATLASGVS